MGYEQIQTGAGGLFVRQKGNDFINHIGRELVREIIETPINHYRVAATDTATNLYGEATEKRYYSAVQLHGLINASPEDITTDEFGPDQSQNIVASFQREYLRTVNNILPQIGDILEWNSSFYEITNINENVFPGGQTEHNYQFVCFCHMTRQNLVLLNNTVVGNNQR